MIVYKLLRLITICNLLHKIVPVLLKHLPVRHNVYSCVLPVFTPHTSFYSNKRSKLAC